MKREEYIDKLAAQLKEWSAKIDEVEARTRAAKTEAKAEYEKQVVLLKDKRAAALKKLEELRSSGGEAWEILKAGAETAWADLRSAVSAAKEKFKKPEEQGN